jgi:hypothetical protein
MEHVHFYPFTSSLLSASRFLVRNSIHEIMTPSHICGYCAPTLTYPYLSGLVDCTDALELPKPWAVLILAHPRIPVRANTTR